MTDKTDSKERDLMELVDAYAEARHIGGCHTYNAKTADARAKVIAHLAANAGSEPVARVNDDGFIVEIGDPPIAPGQKLYLHPSPPEGMVGGWSKGIEAAAALLSKKADDFARENGYDDMGSLSFGRGSHADAKLDYHSSLIELAEEVRAMLNTPPASSADSRKGE